MSEVPHSLQSWVQSFNRLYSQLTSMIFSRYSSYRYNERQRIYVTVVRRVRPRAERWCDCEGHRRWKRAGSTLFCYWFCHWLHIIRTPPWYVDTTYIRILYTHTKTKTFFIAVQTFIAVQIFFPHKPRLVEHTADVYCLQTFIAVQTVQFIGGGCIN